LKLIILILLGAAFILNSIVLDSIYPTAATDYNKYIDRDEVRHLVYEFMFAAFFWLVYSLSKSYLKWFACIFAILVTGSVIDKCFGITDYLISDLFLIIVSIAISLYGFFWEHKQRN
jgi:hypothetical protein